MAGIDTEPLVGHLAAWNYFMSRRYARRTKSSSSKWHAFTGNDDRVTNDPMEAHYIGFNMWVAGGGQQAGTTDPDAVIRQAMYWASDRSEVAFGRLLDGGDERQPPHLPSRC